MIRSPVVTLAAAVAAVLTFAQSADAKCVVPSFVGIAYPPVNEVVIEASTYTACAIHHTTWSFAATGGLNVPQKSLRITKEPRHGSVEIIDNRLIYKSDPGYKGLDSFNYVSDNSRAKLRNYDYKVVVKVD